MTALLTASAVAALLAGCGPSSSSSTTPPPASTSATTPSASPATSPTPVATPDSCNVITSAQASAALGGQSVKPPIRGKATVEGGVACVFYGPDVPPGASPDVPYGDTVRVVLVTGKNAKKWFDDYRTKVTAKTIPGLGDDAYYDGYASISVLKGDYYVRIAVGVANNLAPEEALAKDALAALPAS